MWIVVLLIASASTEPTTTQTYDIDVPGSDPIRIIEGEPLWETTVRQFDNRAFSSDSHIEDPLQQFLNNYAETVRKNKIKDERVKLESVELLQPDHSTERAKSWDYSKRNRPFDDSKGWVSMEPVPWSVSKISKWQSKYKPQNTHKWDHYEPEEDDRPISNYDPYNDKKPTYEQRPLFSKPLAIYNQKVHVNYGGNYPHPHDDNCDKHKYPPPKKNLYQNEDIITDGLPANFPQPYESHRRHGTDLHPDTHPLSGEGEWVLLSTTKGYKHPRERQRSMQINTDAIGAHHGVHLTVLPPLKNSVNMTTSHGGLLQVESTFETVEQSRKQYKKKQQKVKNKKSKSTTKSPRRQIMAPTTQRNSGPDSSAIMAAVGAGMIPATMAMLVPMALGGRKKRDLSDQITVPRNLY